ncbi:MAG: hypothetical protein AAGH46_01540 [Bacteroidota bacterium]
MKDLRLSIGFIACLLIFACESEDSQDLQTPPTLSDDPGVSVIINGDSYSNYNFNDAVYQISKPNPNALHIQAGDENGDQIDLFLNGTGGFSNGAIKEIGNTDENNFMTYALVRQADTQLNYFATTSGQVVIQSNETHPSKEGFRLISGSISLSASTQDALNTLTVVGTFTDLEYQE